MRQIGVDLTTELTQDPVFQLDNENLKQQHPLLIAFRDLWLENNDWISMHYASVFPQANTGPKGGSKSFFSFADSGAKNMNGFSSPLEDPLKQEGINLVVGRHTDTMNAIERKIDDLLKAFEKNYAKYEEIKVFVVTWNVGNFIPSDTFNLAPLFDFQEYPSPDVIAVGLQEHVELSASNVVVGHDGSLDYVWQKILLDQLKKIDSYIVVHKEILVGILLIIFVKEHLRDRISNLDVDIVKTGLAGTLGNKGAVVMKFSIDDSSFSFLNCHMEAGNKQNNSRLMNLVDFHQKAFQQGPIKRPEDKIMYQDYKFLFGDTNFRLNCSYVDARTMIDKYQTLLPTKKEEAQESLKWLLDEDQLLQSRAVSEILDKYQEGKINFLPTYKYDLNTDNYDTSKKQRTPSWTDRILWRCDSGEIRQHFYNRREFQCSDHRPVVSYFSVRVKKLNRAKKQEIVREAYLQIITNQESSQNSEQKSQNSTESS